MTFLGLGSGAGARRVTGNTERHREDQACVMGGHSYLYRQIDIFEQLSEMQSIPGASMTFAGRFEDKPLSWKRREIHRL